MMENKKEGNKTKEEKEKEETNVINQLINRVSNIENTIMARSSPPSKKNENTLYTGMESHAGYGGNKRSINDKIMHFIGENERLRKEISFLKKEIFCKNNVIKTMILNQSGCNINGCYNANNYQYSSEYCDNYNYTGCADNVIYDSNRMDITKY